MPLWAVVKTGLYEYGYEDVMIVDGSQDAAMAFLIRTAHQSAEHYPAPHWKTRRITSGRNEDGSMWSRLELGEISGCYWDATLCESITL